LAGAAETACTFLVVPGVHVSRDLLLVLLVAGLLLNFGLLGLVAAVRHARTPAGRYPRDVPEPSVAPASPRRPMIPDARVAAAQRRFAEAAGDATHGGGTASSTAGVGQNVPQRAATPPAASRARRFTLPPFDDDPERTGRAIASFLGDPVGAPGTSLPHRRRQRGSRAVEGATPRTEVVLSLGGVPPERLAQAAATSLRRTLRGSDALVEEGGGRLRISLATDVAGADAFVHRARSLVDPWLDAIEPPLELRLESPPQPVRDMTPAAS